MLLPTHRLMAKLAALMMMSCAHVETLPGGAAALLPIEFDDESAQLEPRARSEVEAACARIRANPSWGFVLVRGYADELAHPEANLSLGEKRAKVVFQALVDCGVRAERLRVVSFGESRATRLRTTRCVRFSSER